MNNSTIEKNDDPPTESEDSVIADLTWLGLGWDEGPDTPLAKYGPYRQSERDAVYSKVAARLISEGKAYPCFCTAEELDAMKAAQEAGDEAAIKALTDQLAALGA